MIGDTDLQLGVSSVGGCMFELEVRRRDKDKDKVVADRWVSSQEEQAAFSPFAAVRLTVRRDDTSISVLVPTDVLLRLLNGLDERVDAA